MRRWNGWGDEATEVELPAHGEAFLAELIGPALASLDLVLAQTDADARRLAQLGRHAVPVLGNLKFDVVADAALEARGYRWRAAWLARRQGGVLPRFCVVAASTREGEEALLLDAWAGKPSPTRGS